jgi:putative redox protein
MSITLTNQAEYHSTIKNDRGHQISIDTTATDQPKGASPMELLLMGVAGCSSIDIISILKKKKVTYDSLSIDVKGDRVQGKVPSLFTKIHATVYVTGDVAPEKVYRAAELSFTKYCSVSLTLAATAEVTFSVVVNNTPYVPEK